MRLSDIVNSLICVGIDPYFLKRKITGEELAALFEAKEKEKRDSWERTRVLAYNVTAPYMKNKTGIKQFMPLPWDESEKKESTPHTRADFEELVKKMALKMPTNN